MTAGRTVLFSGLTVCRRDGGARRPTAALPLFACRRRRDGRSCVGGDRRALRPVAVVTARDQDQCALDQTRPRRVGYVRRLVPARARSDAPAGGGGARELALLLAAAAPLLSTRSHRPKRRGCPTRPNRRTQPTGTSTRITRAPSVRRSIFLFPTYKPHRSSGLPHPNYRSRFRRFSRTLGRSIHHYMITDNQRCDTLASRGTKLAE